MHVTIKIYKWLKDCSGNTRKRRSTETGGQRHLLAEGIYIKLSETIFLIDSSFLFPRKRRLKEPSELKKWTCQR